jgi:hypothetical protein
VASVRKTILDKVEQGGVCVQHHRLMNALGLSGRNRAEVLGVLKKLEEDKRVTVVRTPTHITICPA